MIGAATPTARAQQANKQLRIGFLAASNSNIPEPLVQKLRDLGHMR